MHRQEAEHSGFPCLTTRTRKWTALLCCSALVLFFSFVVLPALSTALGFSEAHALIIEEKIEAGAWFYIFVEKIWDIEPAVSNTLRYPPGSI